MKKIIFLLLSILLTAVVVTNQQCSHPEVISFSEETLTFQHDSSSLFQSDKRYFILVPGDTAYLCGYQSCTLFVNGIVNNDSTSSDSLYFRTITLDTSSTLGQFSGKLVYPQKYQMSTDFANLSTNEVTRYFTKNDTAVLQLGYDYKGKTQLFPNHQQKVIPRILVMGKMGYFDTDTTSVPSTNKWYTTPLILQPIFSDKGTITFEGFSYAPEAIAFPVNPKQNSSVPYRINGVDYKNGTFLKTKHTITGNIMEKGKVVALYGTVDITRTYFTERGLIDQRMTTLLQKTFSDGTVEIRKKMSYVSRPDTAKIYPESEYP